MSGKGDETRQRIDRAARDEFLRRGYRDASLRAIAREAGVTTGSFYWYYPTKEALFAALVGPHYDHLLRMHREETDAFGRMPRAEQAERVGDAGRECAVRMLDYMLAHRAEFMILLKGADGTPYADMLHELTVREIEANRRLAEGGVLPQPGRGTMRPELEHLLTSGMFQGLFELVIHDVPPEAARECARELHDFFTAGFAYVLRLPLPGRTRERRERP